MPLGTLFFSCLFFSSTANTTEMTQKVVSAHKLHVRRWLNAEPEEILAPRTSSSVQNVDEKVWAKLRMLLTSVVHKVGELRLCEPGNVKCALVLGTPLESAKPTTETTPESPANATKPVDASTESAHREAPVLLAALLVLADAGEEATSDVPEGSQDLQIRFCCEGEEAVQAARVFLTDFPGSYMSDRDGRPLLCSSRGQPRESAVPLTVETLALLEGNVDQLCVFFAPQNSVPTTYPAWK